MKTFLVLLSLSISINSINVNAQTLNDAQNLLNNVTGGSFTQKEAADAIKEGLSKGTGNAVNLIAIKDGYLKNPEIKIPFPPEFKTVETKLRSAGFGKNVDKVILSINRAAEDAGKEAKPIFINAITSLTITDAINIVKGQDNAATSYLKKTSSSELNNKFKPSIKTSLDKVGATKYWSETIKLYNKLPLVKKINPDLAQYVTGKAIDGLFLMVAKEELKIRKDPLSRTTDLLKKVFGK
ncbi:MAG: hypothetical protein A2X08_11500 [Bacteroidetes bacterium GWA2_32_17]|nr:MAG: hypothetical protein A2X08_11500 [Bacteroidetes bacterium GWA2_32_17]